MRFKKFVDYVNSRLIDGRKMLTIDELKYYVSGSYHPVVLDEDFANQIITQWNKEDPAEFGDPFGLLGCVTEALDSDWLASQRQNNPYMFPVVK